MNKNFKKMFNKNNINYYVFENLDHIDDFFYIYNYKDKKMLENLKNLKTINVNFFKKKIKHKLLKKKLVSTINYDILKKTFFLKKKNNLLFIKSHNSISKWNNILYFKKSNLNYFLQKNFEFRSIFNNINLASQLIYNNYKKLVNYFCDYEHLIFVKSLYFNHYNFNFYKNYVKNYYDKTSLNSKKFSKMVERKKVSKYWKRIMMRSFVYNNVKKIKFGKLKLNKYILSQMTLDPDESVYKYKRFKKIYFHKKKFFYINFNKKNNYNNYFSNVYYDAFFFKKRITKRYYGEDYSSNQNDLKINNNRKFVKKKNINFYKTNNNNNKKINLKSKYNKKINLLINNISKKKFNKNSNYLLKYRRRKIKKKKRKIRLMRIQEKKMRTLKFVHKKKNFLNLTAESSKLFLKIVYDKYLLFNFIKNFIKLKIYISNVFNKIFFCNISSILTICLKKYTRWKLTADFLNDLIIVRLKQKFFIKNIMKFVIKYLNKKVIRNKIKGYAILLKGRFSRKDRAVFEWKKRGKTKKTNKMHIIDFSNKSVNLTYSKAAINIWITRNA